MTGLKLPYTITMYPRFLGDFSPPSHLFWVYLADERDCAEILEAERGELEELQRHEGHHDVQAEQAHLGRAQRLLLLLLVARAAL